MKSLLSTPIRVTLDYNSLSCKVLLRGVDIDLTLEEIAQQLQSRGHYPVLLRRFTRLEGGLRCPTTTVLASFLADAPPTDVAIYYCVYRCDVFHDRPSICKNCKRYGHSKVRCRSIFRCGRCGESHTQGDCDSQVLTCPGCSGPHVATDPSCPRYLDAVKILAVQETDHCSYQDASRRVLRPSYASTTAAPPPPPAQPPPPPSPHCSRLPSQRASTTVASPVSQPFDTASFFADIRNTLDTIKAQFLAELTARIKDIVASALSQLRLPHLSSPPSPPRKFSQPRAPISSAATSATTPQPSRSASPAPPQPAGTSSQSTSKSISSPSSTALHNKFDLVKTTRRSGAPVST